MSRMSSGAKKPGVPARFERSESSRSTMSPGSRSFLRSVGLSDAVSLVLRVRLALLLLQLCDVAKGLGVGEVRHAEVGDLDTLAVGRPEEVGRFNVAVDDTIVVY
jgi:hypothetical protein